jgi:DNA modification methylase
MKKQLSEPRRVDQRRSIVDCPIADIRLNPNNPRLHTPNQIRQIARSIEAFGFNVPVLIDARGQVIAGHGRVLAAQLLGMTQVPTILLEHLTEAQIRAFMITDNRLTENSAWDDRLLAEQFKALSEFDLNFNVEVTGFEMAEIDLRMESLTPARRGKNDPADAIPEAGAKPQVTRTGDRWVLDRHRVCCGDARNESIYSPLMEGQRAKMVFTDPPHNDPIHGHVKGFESIPDSEFPVASGEVSESEFTEFLTNALVQLARNTVDGALHFICMDWQHTGELIAAARPVYTEFKDLCVWVKDNAGPDALYRGRHELVFVFQSGKAPSGNNTQQGQHGRHRTNVWRYRCVNSLSLNSGEGKLSAPYRTIKPVELIADAILDCTARGDIVLDPFLGSGTSVIAAERTGRVCYGIELDPRYVDTIVRRWQIFTGQDAIQESTGRTFNEIEEENHGAE